MTDRLPYSLQGYAATRSESEQAVLDELSQTLEINANWVPGERLLKRLAELFRHWDESVWRLDPRLRSWQQVVEAYDRQHPVPFAQLPWLESSDYLVAQALVTPSPVPYPEAYAALQSLLLWTLRVAPQRAHRLAEEVRRIAYPKSRVYPLLSDFPALKRIPYPAYLERLKRWLEQHADETNPSRRQIIARLNALHPLLVAWGQSTQLDSTAASVSASVSTATPPSEALPAPNPPASQRPTPMVLRSALLWNSDEEEAERELPTLTGSAMAWTMLTEPESTATEEVPEMLFALTEEAEVAESERPDEETLQQKAHYSGYWLQHHADLTVSSASVLTPLERRHLVQALTADLAHPEESRRQPALLAALIYLTGQPLDRWLIASPSGEPSCITLHGTLRLRLPRPPDAFSIPAGTESFYAPLLPDTLELPLPEMVAQPLRQRVAATLGPVPDFPTLFGASPEQLQPLLQEYLTELRESGRYALTLSRLTHALVHSIHTHQDDRLMAYLFRQDPRDRPPPISYYRALTATGIASTYRHLTERLWYGNAS